MSSVSKTIFVKFILQTLSSLPVLITDFFPNTQEVVIETEKFRDC